MTKAMICKKCGLSGINAAGDARYPYTLCPHCGGVNCHEISGEMQHVAPSPALSVRQPWAWAIAAGHKRVENRSTAALRHIAVQAGRLDNRWICIHAAKGMTRREYEDAADFMAGLGVTCPAPADLVRGAIIARAFLLGVARRSEDPWFFGPAALLLADVRAIDPPIPAAGALGLFFWRRGGTIEDPKPWMTRAPSPEAGAPPELPL